MLPGLRTAAFFFGHQVMHLIDIVVQPAIFMSLYYTLPLPEIKFMDYYISESRHLSSHHPSKISDMRQITPSFPRHFAWHRHTVVLPSPPSVTSRIAEEPIRETGAT